jgi:RES domain-containing protein
VPVLYRVFPFVAAAAVDDAGGPLYIPPQGGGRLDNPDLFHVLYLSDAAAGAIAEAFGRFPEWTRAILEGSPALPGSVRALARYRLADDVPVCDLDDPRQLRALGLRPSDVVSRDYVRTRAWARRLYESHAWAGVRWWSYYDPRWASFGLWDPGRLRVEEVVPLALDDPALLEASRTIARRVAG